MARHDYGIWSRCSSFARFAPPRSPLSVPRAGGANSIVLHEAKRARPPRHAARGRGVPTRLLEHDVRPCVKQNNFFIATYCAAGASGAAFSPASRDAAIDRAAHPRRSRRPYSNRRGAFRHAPQPRRVPPLPPLTPPHRRLGRRRHGRQRARLRGRNAAALRLRGPVVSERATYPTHAPTLPTLPPLPHRCPPPRLD